MVFGEVIDPTKKPEGNAVLFWPKDHDVLEPRLGLKRHVKKKLHALF